MLIKSKIGIYMLPAALFLLLLNGCKKSDQGDLSVVKDGDGNIYNSVTIGTQTWLTENLKTTKFNDGSVIPQVSDNVAWQNVISPGFCWYNNDQSMINTYGALYNWYAVNSNKLCPAGWHVPSDGEWKTLTTYLGGELTAGGKMKEVGMGHWIYGNAGATNESGFDALPAGLRRSDGSFGFINYGDEWWSSTNSGNNSDYCYYVSSMAAKLGREQMGYNLGLSVRCIRN